MSWTATSSAEQKIVFDDIEGIYSDLQSLEKYSQTIVLQDEKIGNLEKQLEVLDEQNKLLEEQLLLLKQQISSLELLSQKQAYTITQFEKLLEMQDSVYKNVIDEIKPSFFDKVKEGSLFLGIGVIIGLIIL